MVVVVANGFSMRVRLLSALLLLSFASSACAASVFRTRPDDPTAVAVTGAHADGVGDDSAAVERDLDQAAGTTSGGLVFVPSGRYRLSVRCTSHRACG